MLGTIAFCLLFGLAGAEVPGVQADKNQEVEREIKALELHLANLLVRGSDRAVSARCSFVAAAAGIS